jgi:hypothetical protein
MTVRDKTGTAGRGTPRVPPGGGPSGPSGPTGPAGNGVAFANPAALGAYDASALPGFSLAGVGVVNDSYQLLKAPSSAVLAAADGLNVVPATAPVGAVWARRYERNLPAQYESAWWIDPVSGNDTNSGTAVGAPLKTLSEWCNRMMGAVVAQNVTVTCAPGTITGDFILDITINSPYVVTFVGDTTVDGGHTLTGVTASVPSTNTRGFLTSADNFTDRQRIRFTSGTRSGYICYVTGINGVATSAYVSTPGVVTNFAPTASATPTTGFPAIGDTYVVETLNTTLNPPVVNARVRGIGRLLFKNFNLSTLFNGNTQLAIWCIENQNPGAFTTSAFFYGCALPASGDFLWLAGSQAYFVNCWFNGSVASVNSSVLFFRTSVFRKAGGSFGGLYVGENGYVQLATSNVFDSGSIVMDKGEIEMNGGDVQVCDGAGGSWCTTAVGSTIYGHASNRMWGAASGFNRSFQLFTGSIVSYSFLPTVLSTSTPNDLSINTTIKAYTDLPFSNTAYATTMAPLL